MAQPFSAEALKPLTRVVYLRAVAGIAWEWAWLVAAVALAQTADVWWATGAALVFIADRQHGLAFMVHEGAHTLVSRNKTLNDLTVDLLCAWPLFMHVQAYRVNHLAHHQHLNTARDPDWARKQDGEWVFPTSSGRLAALFLGSFVGAYAWRTFRAVWGRDAVEHGLIERTSTPLGWQLGRVTFYALLAAGLTHFGLWRVYAVYWLLPLLTWFQVLNRLRKLAEHFGVYERSHETTTRTVLPSWPARVFISPKNIFFHGEHHEFTAVPYYALPQLHRALQGDPVYAARFHLTRDGYWGVLKECVGLNAAPALAPEEHR